MEFGWVMGKRDTNRDEKRQLIVTTARKLMQVREVSDFSMRTLAEVAGVSSATPYALFGSKQALIAAVMDTDFADFMTALTAEPNQGFDVFFRLVDVTAELFEKNPGYYSTGAQAIQATTDQTLTSHFSLPRHGLFKDLVSDAIQRGEICHQINPDSLALNLGHQFYGWIQAWAKGNITLPDMVARTKYGLGLGLAAVATEASRAQLLEQVVAIQATLPEAGVLKTKPTPNKKQEAVS
ncbi:MAG: TetR/AcrR family transcriptional regulator [SAR86 cluster bacterium]|uniref:TetR/AcrR family transcriptional regulator n=1 Tax=SAR86 cluster bacterium TaxID=2030880 RepID=A0A972VZY7_9GAMM|nr:TetR/AcrR family transcriptional regulator [SAR86 cluster bacterium]